MACSGSLDLSFEVALQVVVFQQNPVLHDLMPSLDFALGLGAVGSTNGVLDASLVGPIGQGARDIDRPVLGQEPWLLDDRRSIAA